MVRSSTGHHSAGLGMPEPFILLALVLLSACGPSPVSPGVATSTRTPVQLGPTSTSAPATSTPPAANPTPTLVPLEPIDSDDWQRGPSDAPVTLLLYTDVHCLTCRQLHSDLAALIERHAGDVRLIVRLFPLIENRPLAGTAAEALLSAGESGSFWELFDFLTARYSEWVGLDPADFIEWLASGSAEIGLDREAVRQDLVSGQFSDQVTRIYETRLAQGMPGVPVLLINSNPFPITADPASLEAAVRLALLSEKQFHSPPPMVIDADREYLAEIEFDGGMVVVQLFASESPVAVNSFVFLARQGWYDNTPISRSIPGVLVEAGDPTGTGLGNPGYYFPSESDPSLSFDRAGIVGLSNSGPGTNGGRFFVALREMSGLEETHTVLGRVIEGLEILTDLSPYDPIRDLLADPPLRIQEVRIQEID